MATTPHQKFTFDTEFFEVLGSKAAASGAPVTPQATMGLSPRSTEAKLQQAHDEGFALGVTEGQAQAQTDLARLQQHLQNTLISLQETVTAREENLLQLCLGLLQGSLHNILGHASQHYGAEILEHHLRALLLLAKTDEALTLRIHPSARGYHEKLGLPQATILGLPLRIIPDSSLGPVDALMEWQHGGVEARLADHTTALQSLLTAAGATALPKPDFTSATATPAPAAPALPPLAVPPTAAEDRAARAAALLGDDDLVDALK